MNNRLTETEFISAIKYNDNNRGILYKEKDLPAYFKNLSVEDFTMRIISFQLDNGLMVDGKLGRNTLRKIYDVTINGPSNCIIFNGQSIKLPDRIINAGFTASNYLYDKEVKFKSTKRAGNPIHFVLHETCGNTSQGCINTLLRKGYGVHLVLDPLGHLTCHGDLILDRMIHANQLNSSSIGLEVVNPYTPIYIKDNNVFDKVIDRQWWTWVPRESTPGIQQLLKRKGLSKIPNGYVVPTYRQLHFLDMLVPWVCSVIGIRYEFPTKNMRRGTEKYVIPEMGVVAHQDFANHADGRYILERLIERG